MLLIFPPVAKPGEPPAGVALLAGALSAHGISCDLFDANIEGLLYVLGQAKTAPDTWSRRAVKNISKDIGGLRSPMTYQSPGRYSRSVRDVNRVLEISGDRGASISLTDYRSLGLSPLRSADLVWAAERPEENLYHPWFKKRLPEVLDHAAAGMVGFSLNYLSQALTTFAMIGFIRKKYPEMKILLGGGLVNSWMHRPGFRDPFSGLVDLMMAGPGEGPLLGLHGVRDATKRHYTPDYASLPGREYLSPGFILPYSGSKGCYWSRCSFCPETAEDNPYDPVPVSQATASLKTLVEATRPALIHLLDNSVNPALLRALASESLGAPWYGFARIAQDLCELDYCMALRRSGCVMLKLGLESGDQGVLDRLEKGLDLKTASKALTNLAKAGIASYVYLLFGTPAETAVEARRTLGFVAAHADAITFLNLALFNLPVCGAEAARYETSQFYEGDLSLYTGFVHPRGWNRKEVRRFLDAEFKRHPAVAAIIKNEPPVFTSNHAAFFTDAFRSARRGKP